MNVYDRTVTKFKGHFSLTGSMTFAVFVKMLSKIIVLELNYWI